MRELVLFAGLFLLVTKQIDTHTIMNMQVRDFNYQWKDEDLPINDSCRLIIKICAGFIVSSDPTNMGCEFIIDSIEINNITSVTNSFQVPISDESEPWPLKEWRLTSIITTSNTSEQIEISTDFNNVTSYSEEQFIENGTVSFYFTLVCSEPQCGPTCRNTCHTENKSLILNEENISCGEIKEENTCISGWQGDQCDIPICKNCVYGVCVGPNICNCTSGWNGPFCNDCKILDGCKHGYCQKANQCICEEYWAGEHCDVDLNYCINHPGICLNGGSCTTSGKKNYFYCECTKDYQGPHCEIPILSSCENLNCGLYGFCDNSLPIAKCECIEFYYGPRCQYHVNDEEEMDESPGSALLIIAIGATFLLIFLMIVGYIFKKVYRQKTNKQNPLHSTRCHQDNTELTYVSYADAVSSPPADEKIYVQTDV